MSELVITDLGTDSIPALAWSGQPTHLRYVAEAVERAALGEVNLLVAWHGDDAVGLGGVDFSPAGSQSGKLWMLAVKETHRGQGIGTLLMEELEKRARQHGCKFAELSVEKDNKKAKTLYERLGFVVIGNTTESWEQESPEGVVSTYYADCFVMRKLLDD